MSFENTINEILRDLKVNVDAHEEPSIDYLSHLMISLVEDFF